MDASQIQSTVEWLRYQFSIRDGAINSTEVKALARIAGIGESTLKRAARALRVVFHSQPTFPRTTIWRYSETRKEANIICPICLTERSGLAPASCEDQTHGQSQPCVGIMMPLEDFNRAEWQSVDPSPSNPRVRFVTMTEWIDPEYFK